MNFFGHAALAASHFGAQEPAPQPAQLATLCVGAMLPDFIGMLRLGRPTVSDAVLATGIAFHHRSDEAFHDLPAFLRLSRDAFAWLSERALPRGPARAVAHVGVEILLDEVWAQRSEARDSYRAALRVSCVGRLTFETPDALDRLAALQQVLLERSTTTVRPAAELVAERLARTLANRPRLALDAPGQRLVSEWVTVTRPRVAPEAPQIFAALRGLLANFRGSE